MRIILISLLLSGCTNIYVIGHDNLVNFHPDVWNKKKAAPERAAKVHKKHIGLANIQLFPAGDQSCASDFLPGFDCRFNALLVRCISGALDQPFLR